ncbi:MAG: hypothetical protein HY812_06325 [Planctomycetes bacterium]|nr:hypothetical protein [Planctomycetota bacterium]
MSTLQFCSRCEGSILKTEPIHFTRRQQPLCPSCHVEYVEEKRLKARAHLRERVEQEPVDWTMRANVAVGVVVALLIAGFAALMILR